jgi:hypothetical protein
LGGQRPPVGWALAGSVRLRRIALTPETMPRAVLAEQHIPSAVGEPAARHSAIEAEV